MSRWIPVLYLAVAVSTIESFAGQPAPEPIPAQRARVAYLDYGIVAADRIGVIDSELATEGDAVRAGEVVVRLQSAVPAAALAVAEAKAEAEFQVEAARKEFAVSEVELGMAREANAAVADAVPGIEVLRLELTRDRNELRIDFAESEQEIARLERDRLAAELDTFEVRTPIGGTVVRVHKAQGEPVSQGEPIFEVADAREMRVEGYVTVAQSLRIERGDEVVVRPRIEGLELPAAESESKGRVVFVDLAVNRVTGLVLVWARVENPHGLLLEGLEAEMLVRPDTARDVPEAGSAVPAAE